MAEIQNIPVDYLISEHSDSPEKDEPPKKRFKSSTRQHMVKYVLTRSGEFVIRYNRTKIFLIRINFFFVL